MSRSSIPTLLLVCAAALAAPSGCTVETESASDILPVTGTVTLDGVPVKRAVIRFTPIHNQGVSSSGEVIDGAIRHLTTRTANDGLKVGRYRVSISGIDSFMQESMEDPKARGSNGPDLSKLSSLVMTYKNPLPTRYSNEISSGLIVEVTRPGPNELRFDLKGDEPTAPKESGGAAGSTPSKSP